MSNKSQYCKINFFLSILKDMIFPTSVIIVIVRQRVEWEINCVTSRQSGNGRQSQPNGVIIAIEDYLISLDNKYNSNNTTQLIESKASSYICRVSSLLKNLSEAIS